MSIITAEEFIKNKNAAWEEEKEQQKTRGFKDISRQGKHHFYRQAWTFMPQHNLKEKVFVVERLKRIKIEGKNTHLDLAIDDIEYRFGYYIVGSIGNKKGKWTWGQYCPLIPAKDLKPLLQKAEKEGTIL